MGRNVHVISGENGCEPIVPPTTPPVVQEAPITTNQDRRDTLTSRIRAVSKLSFRPVSKRLGGAPGLPDSAFGEFVAKASDVKLQAFIQAREGALRTTANSITQRMNQEGMTNESPEIVLDLARLAFDRAEADVAQVEWARRRMVPPPSGVEIRRVSAAFVEKVKAEMEKYQASAREHPRDDGARLLALAKTLDAERVLNTSIMDTPGVWESLDQSLTQGLKQDLSIRTQISAEDRRREKFWSTLVEGFALPTFEKIFKALIWGGVVVGGVLALKYGADIAKAARKPRA